MSSSNVNLQRYLQVASLVAGGGQIRMEDTRELAGQQENYSLAWYFEKLLARDLDPTSPSYNGLLDAYLGGNQTDWVKAVVPTPEQLCEEDYLLDECFPQSVFPLNSSQRAAVHAALHNPLTVVIGPPGTGKTETILRILALAVARGESVAMVSSNHSAVNNVIKKVQAQHVEGPAPEGDLMARLEERLVPLGNARDRSGATDEHGKPFGFATVPKKGKPCIHEDLSLGWEQSIQLDDFCKGPDGARCITSTIHSLKKCFADGDEAKYDLIVVDEASQSSVLLGIVAMSSARRMVVVGDDNQLPPVVPETFGQSLADALGDERGLVELMRGGPYDLSSEKLSFLGSCQMVFGSGIEVMLDEHYRCHPAIIGFCNEYVYENKLKVCTELLPDAPSFPIGVRWYEGSFCEEDVCWECGKVRPGNARQTEGRWRHSSANFRQLSILADEEMDHIRLLYRQGKSLCFVSPFWAQMQRIEELISRELGLSDDEVGHALEGAEGEDDEQLSVLTIHRSQGLEFDCVYLLPVEDGVWEWPWSQGMRLVNVAVSRAKRELHLIVSTKLMSDAAQMRLVGRALPVSHLVDEGKSDADQQLYVRKLVDYVLEHLEDCADGPAWCGVHKARIASTFDWVCWLQRDLGDGKEVSSNAVQKALHPSAAEALVRAGLVHLDEPGLAVARNVWISALCWKGESLVDVAKDFGLSSRAHFDYVLFEQQTRRVVVLLEVDGNQHRYDGYQDPRGRSRAGNGSGARRRQTYGSNQARDWAKEQLVRRLGGTCAWLGKPGRHQLSKVLQKDGRHTLVPGDAGCEGGEPNRLDGWVRSPGQVPKGSPLLFLRIPTDGSTLGEFSCLDRGEGRDLGCRPTVDAYVRRQRSAMNAHGDVLTISEKVRKEAELATPESEGGKIISSFLSGRDDGKEARQNMTAKLVRMGILSCDEVTGRTQPTELGIFLGISVSQGMDDDECVVTYDRVAQRLMRELFRA